MRKDPHGRNLRKGRISIAGQVYLVTTATRDRRPILAPLLHARAVILTIAGLHGAGACRSLAFVVMPDHVHWLVELGARGLPSLMKTLKSESAWRINRCRGVDAVPVWQRGYHDHAVRREEDLRRVARYIIANPLRAGLANGVGDYSHWDAIWL